MPESIVPSRVGPFFEGLVEVKEVYDRLAQGTLRPRREPCDVCGDTPPFRGGGVQERSGVVTVVRAGVEGGIVEGPGEAAQ